jgi:hypothetical protein
MRLWSIHPRYLDPQGLVALWREALLAQAVLFGKTRGYRNHPQLCRFLDASNPETAIGAYLNYVCDEAERRGYSFDSAKIIRPGRRGRLKCTSGQIAYEWRHLQAKLLVRAPEWSKQWHAEHDIQPHPIFVPHEGPVEDWERVQADA